MDLVSFSREFSLEQPEVNEAGKVLGGVSIREWFNAKLSSTAQIIANQTEKRPQDTDILAKVKSLL